MELNDLFESVAGAVLSESSLVTTWVPRYIY